MFIMIFCVMLNYRYFFFSDKKIYVAKTQDCSSNQKKKKKEFFSKLFFCEQTSRNILKSIFIVLQPRLNQRRTIQFQ